MIAYPEIGDFLAEELGPIEDFLNAHPESLPAPRTGRTERIAS